MDPSRNYPLGLRVVVTVLLLFSHAFLPSISVETSSYSERSVEQRKNKVLGSRPPSCVNKCKNCRPCKATLVIPPPHQRRGYTEYSHREDGSYYLLAWKCRCGDKLFQP